MSSPQQNGFVNILAMEAVISNSYLYEKRLILDPDTGQTLYVAFNQTPNASTADSTWFALKFHYQTVGDKDYLSRVQLPDDGFGFLYSVDDIATYFS